MLFCVVLLTFHPVGVGPSVVFKILSFYNLVVYCFVDLDLGLDNITLIHIYIYLYDCKSDKIYYYY